MRIIPFKAIFFNPLQSTSIYVWSSTVFPFTFLPPLSKNDQFLVLLIVTSPNNDKCTSPTNCPSYEKGISVAPK